MSRKDKKVEWIEFSWPGAYPIQCLPPQKAWCFDFAKYGYPLSKMAVTFTNDVLSFYAIKKEYERDGKALFERTFKDPSFILKILNETNLVANKIFLLERKWSRLNFRVMSNQHLLQYHKELFDIDEILWRKGQVQNLLEMGNNFVTTYVRNSLASLYGSKKEIGHFQAISTPTYSTKTELQDRDFVKLCGKFKSEKEEQKEALIRRHWQKYRWMNYGWVGPAISLETFRQNVKKAARQPRISSKTEEKFVLKVNLLFLQKALLKKLPQPLKNMCLVLREIMDAKARRVDAHSLTYFLADPLLVEIGRRLGLSLNQLRVMDPPRVRTLFKEFDVDEINEELKYVTHWYEKGGTIKKYVGHQAESKMRQVLAGLPKVTKQTELTGEMAYPGKVKGRVRIILKAKEIGKFKKGGILVTGMTDPGFVPAMRIAKAVVTNSGGITCHAAIISRELQVPCVIGTKFATKILKDGDLIEVDANKGTVKKISV